MSLESTVQVYNPKKDFDAFAQEDKATCLDTNNLAEMGCLSNVPSYFKKGTVDGILGTTGSLMMHVGVLYFSSWIGPFITPTAVRMIKENIDNDRLTTIDALTVFGIAYSWSNLAYSLAQQGDLSPTTVAAAACLMFPSLVYENAHDYSTQLPASTE